MFSEHIVGIFYTVLQSTLSVYFYIIFYRTLPYYMTGFLKLNILITSKTVTQYIANTLSGIYINTNIYIYIYIYR